MIRFARNASIVAALAYFALAANSVRTALIPAEPMPTYSPPVNWKYAAAKASHTFHAKGSPCMPKNVPPQDMVYGNSVAEMLGRQKNACLYCIKAEMASVSRAPHTTPSAKETQ